MALDILGPANAPNSTTARPADDRAFGATDTWFKDCSSSVANDGTKLKAAFLNSAAAFARNLVRMNGNTGLGVAIVTENNADDAMAVKAVQHMQQRGQPSYAVDTGTADAMVVALLPALAEYKAGMVVTVLKSAASNTTGAVTLNVNGLGAKTVIAPNGLPLRKGDLAASQIMRLAYDGTAFQLVSVAGGDASPRNTAVITSGSGNWIVPAGVYRLYVEVLGSGGGGGGGGTGNGGSGGGAGGYAYKVMDVVPGQSIPYVCPGGGGNGGGGGTGPTNGATGGTTSFGGVSSTGGGQGFAAPTGSGGAAGLGAGGDFNAFGGGGQISGGSKGGDGAGSYFGSGGIALIGTTSGSGGVLGSGGAGGWNQQAGGSGAGGLILIKY